MYEVNSSEIRIFIGTSLESKPENDSAIPNGSKFIETDTKVSYDFADGNWNPAGSTDVTSITDALSALSDSYDVHTHSSIIASNDTHAYQIWVGTDTAYDAITTKDDYTLYFAKVTEEV